MNNASLATASLGFCQPLPGVPNLKRCADVVTTRVDQHNGAQ